MPESELDCPEKRVAELFELKKSGRYDELVRIWRTSNDQHVTQPPVRGVGEIIRQIIKSEFGHRILN